MGQILWGSSLGDDTRGEKQREVRKINTTAHTEFHGAGNPIGKEVNTITKEDGKD